MFKTILVATDGSDHADKAIAVAGDLAAKYDANMTLLHVLLRRNAAVADLRKLIDVEKLPDGPREEFERFESMGASSVASTDGAIAVSLPLPGVYSWPLAMLSSTRPKASQRNTEQEKSIG